LKFLPALFPIALLTFLTDIVLNSHSHEDRWIPENVEISFIIVAVSYAVFLLTVRRHSLLVLGTGTFLGILAVVPSIKYGFVYGTFDSAAHYGFSMELLYTGHVPESGFYSAEYSALAGMHTFLVSQSIISSLSVSDSFAILLFVAAFAAPFAVYLGVGHLVRANELSVRALMASVIISVPVFYYVSGSLFGLLLLIFLVMTLFRVQGNVEATRTPSTPIALIFFVALVLSHGLTALYAVLAVFALFLLSPKHRLIGRPITKGFVALTLTILAAWWVYVAVFYPSAISGAVHAILVRELATPPPGFVALPLEEKLFVLVARYSRYFLGVFATLAGILLYVRRRTSFGPALRFTSRMAVYLSILPMMALIAVLGPFPVHTYERFLVLALLAAPIPVSLLWRARNTTANSGMRRNAAKSLALAFAVFVGTTSVYTADFLIPTRTVSIRQTQIEVPIADYNLVNTEYKLTAIAFLRTNFDQGRIDADLLTEWQFAGFARGLYDQAIDNPGRAGRGPGR